MPPETALSGAERAGAPAAAQARPSWRSALVALAPCIAALFVLTAREWGEMAHQWWNIDTYNHILLVPPIIAWLVWLKADDLKAIGPRPYGPALSLAAAALALWLAGRASGINLIAHIGAVGAMQASVAAMIGIRASMVIALPIGMAAFLVPFGDEIIPLLQAITAQIAISLTRWSGIPAMIDGIFIDTPAGLFVVAEACSGVKFLVAMITLAVIVCFTRFASWRKRAAFMAAAIIVPILTNGVRAWGTIYIAQFAGVEFAAGFDHVFYGWIFFAIVVSIVLACAWPFFEAEPEDYGLRADDLVSPGWLRTVEGRAEAPLTIAGALFGLALAFALGQRMLVSVIAG